MRRFKNLTSKAVQGELGLTGHFWEGRHDRRRLKDTWDLVVAIAYDHRNPVRAGIVSRPEEYARSSARWWTAGTDPHLALCRRHDVPFESLELLRARVLQLQREKRLDDVMESLAKSHLRIDSARGRALLERLMREADLDPLRCGSAAAVHRVQPA